MYLSRSLAAEWLLTRLPHTKCRAIRSTPPKILFGGLLLHQLPEAVVAIDYSTAALLTDITSQILGHTIRSMGK
jgi:hypothetical protein